MNQEYQAHKGIRVKMALRESKVHQVCRGWRDLQESWELRVLPVLSVLLGYLENPELKENGA